MAEEIHNPHDLIVRAVLSDLTEASSFLQAHLPDEVSQGLNWSTLRLVEGSFVDEDLRGSEADLLYEVEHGSGQDAVWLYVLLEHQSAPDRWMRFRLLKYLPNLGYEFTRSTRSARTSTACAIGLLSGRTDLVILPRVCRPVCRVGAGLARCAALFS